MKGGRRFRVLVLASRGVSTDRDEVNGWNGSFSLDVLLVEHLRSWRYCVGARLKFWQRSRVPKKGSRDTTLLQRLRRQIALDYYTIPPATQASRARNSSH